MSFYTFCDSIGSKIYHRYIDDAGKRHQEIISGFPIELFIKGNGEHRSLYGDKLSKLEFDNISDAKECIKRYKGIMPVFGQTSMHHQFIAHKYPGTIEYNFDKIRILNFDIETRFDGCEDEDEVLVRRNFAETPESVTVGYMKTLSDIWEVYDDVNERWYPVSKCPQQNPGGFPEAKDADYEITSISAKLFGRDQKVTFGLKPYTVKDKNQIYTLCTDEADLLTQFINFIRLMDPDILTGWNIDTFDIPYIVNRSRKVLGEKMTNKLSPFHASTDKCISEYFTDKDKTEIGYRIFGITAMDYMDLYKSYNPKKQEGYSLDNISEVELKEKKLDYSEFNGLMDLYKRDFERYIDYNERDVYLVERLDQKKQFIRLIVTVILMTKSRYQESAGKVRIWDNLIYNLLLDEGVVIPPEDIGRGGEKIKGAYVKDPIPGKYRWVAALDLTSLYPSICMMFNMSPETLVREEQGRLDWVERMLNGEDLSADCRKAGYAMSANGAAFRLDKVGVLPKGMRYVFDTRKRYKNLMLAEKSKKEKYLKDGGKDAGELKIFDDQIATLDAVQNAMKTLANSGYGVSANHAFRYFNRSIAEGITLTGQLGIQYISNAINAKLNAEFGTDRDYVITCDTDSAYLTLDRVPSDPKNIQQSVDEIDKFIEEILQPHINASYQKLSDLLGAPKNMMDMKREVIADVGIFRGKKNYVLRVWDNEGVRYAEHDLKMTGIETARSDKPMIVRKKLTSDLEILLGGTQEQLLESIEAFKKEFYTAPVEIIAKPMGVSDMKKWIGPDGNPKTGIPYNCKAAWSHNTLIIEKGLQKTVDRIRNGNKIKMMPLKKINPIHSNYIGFLGTLPTEFGLDEYLDKDAQWKSAYISPLTSFTDVIGWKTEKVSSLESLFG